MRIGCLAEPARHHLPSNRQQDYQTKISNPADAAFRQLCQAPAMNASQISLAKKTLLTTSLLALFTYGAAALPNAVFQPGQLAVLQLGDGGTNRCLPLGSITGITNYAASDIFGSRQTQVFIDQFDPNGINQTNAVIQSRRSFPDERAGWLVNRERQRRRQRQT